jgi:hypothetical protein
MEVRPTPTGGAAITLERDEVEDLAAFLRQCYRRDMSLMDFLVEDLNRKSPWIRWLRSRARRTREACAHD